MPGAAADPKPADLFLREQFDLAVLEAPDGDGGVFNADGTVNMVLLRPCNGRGPGNSIYEADMLARDAKNFVGWSMFDNHDSPVAKRARNGLPRAPSELAGAIRESFWDPNFTTPHDGAMGFGAGAVIGKCALTDTMEALVRKIPEAVKGSLNAQAAGKRLGSRDGKRGWIIEGIVNDPENSSFDLVTKAGAGGRVASLLEALYDPSNATDGLSVLEAVEDDQLVAWLREHRPTILEGGNEMNLQEALQSDEVKAFIGTQIQEGIVAALPAALDVRESELREALRDELGQTSRMRGLHVEACRLIEAAPLSKTAKAYLLEDYGIVENDDDTVTPGRCLALVEAQVDADGKVVKTAKAVLADEIDSDVKRTRNMLREHAPTLPQAPGAGGDNAVGGAAFGSDGSAWAERVKARGMDPAMFGAQKPAPAGA